MKTSPVMRKMPLATLAEQELLGMQLLTPDELAKLEAPGGVAAGTTAKAVVKLSLGVYRERGCFFVVERAAGAIVFACFFEFYAAINDLDDVKAIQQVIKKCLGESRHG